jgi:hypothetical protein
MMEVVDLFFKAWPVLLAIITLIVVLSKLDLRVAVLEEKMKAAWEQINKAKNG